MVAVFPDIYQCHGNNVGPMGTLRRGNGAVTGGVPFMVDTFSDAITCDTGDRTHALTSEGADASEDGTGRGTPIVNTPFAFHENSRAEVRVTDIAGNLTTGGGKPGQGYPAIHDGIGVRRLTPRECERLQGFDDDWTATGINEKGIEIPISDAQRYRQLGNSLAIPVFEDIAYRLVEVDRISTNILDR